jgi:hypothetical protein
MTVDAPLPSLVIFSVATADRLDRAFVALGDSGTGSAEFLGVVFGAVVFAMLLFLSYESFDK